MDSPSVRRVAQTRPSSPGGGRGGNFCLQNDTLVWIQNRNQSQAGHCARARAGQHQSGRWWPFGECHGVDVGCWLRTLGTWLRAAKGL